MVQRGALAKKRAGNTASTAAAQRAKIALDLARAHAQEEAHEKDM
jgi:hypothetical protein